MRIISVRHLNAYAAAHPEARVQLERWYATVKGGQWSSMDEVKASFSKAKTLNGERMRFEIAGGDFRLIASFDFRRQWVFIKFIGTHAEYDRIDALTVAQF